MDLRIKAVLILAACLFSGACKTAEFHHEQIDVHGMVYDFENRPVGGYAVTLGGRKPVVSDAMGRYAFPSVPAGEYVLAGSMEGWEEYETLVSVNSRTAVQYLRVASAEELLTLADAALGTGDVEGAAQYVTRAEKTGSKSFLIPYYAAVTAFRSGKPKDSLAILTAIEASGVRDSAVRRMRLDMQSISEGALHEAR